MLKIFAQVWAAFFSAKILKNFNVSSFFSSKKGSPKEFCVFLMLKKRKLMFFGFFNRGI